MLSINLENWFYGLQQAMQANRLNLRKATKHAASNSGKKT
jgi:hypothetical protein